jgi:putative nucleotidyltransferase with HDIG domain
VNTGFNGDVAYTAGLLHDIGRFAMLSCWPREYSHLLATSQATDGLQLEFESLGVSHTEAGAFLLQRWGLPSNLVEVAREHHCNTPWGRSSHVELVSRGCNMADCLGFTVTPQVPASGAADDMPASGKDTFWLRIADGINQLDCL